MQSDSRQFPNNRSGDTEILVVEDEAVAARQLRHLLQELGHTVVGIAYNAAEATAQAREKRPGLVLMDIKLQGDAGAGIRAADEIWRELRIPIIYTTAFIDDDTLQEATRTVPFGFLRKPFGMSDLRASIQVAMARRQAEVAEEIARRQAELRARQQARIAALGLEALKGLPRPRLMERAVAAATSLLQAQSAFIAQVKPNQTSLIIETATGRAFNGLTGIEPGGTLYRYALHSPEPALLHDLQGETRFTLPAILQEHGVRSAICAVITPAGQPWGVMGVHATEPGAFSGEDAHFVQGIANIIATAIEREQAAAQILELSTPILPIGDRLLMVPLVGMIDEQRILRLEAHLFPAIRAKRAKVVVIDVTGAVSAESAFASRLSRTILAARLIGAEVVLTGISTELAEALGRPGDLILGLRTVGDLQGGIEEAQRLLGGLSSHLDR